MRQAGVRQGRDAQAAPHNGRSQREVVPHSALCRGRGALPPFLRRERRCQGLDIHAQPAGLRGCIDSSRDDVSGAGSSVANNEKEAIDAATEAHDDQILRDSSHGLAARLDPLIEDAAAQSPHAVRPSPARPQDTSAGALPHSRHSTRCAGRERERTSAWCSNAGKGKSPAHT